MNCESSDFRLSDLRYDTDSTVIVRSASGEISDRTVRFLISVDNCLHCAEVGQRWRVRGDAQHAVV